MRGRVFSLSGPFLGIILILAGQIQAEDALPAGEAEPLETLLNPNGSLKLDTGFVGRLDPTGYRMVTSAAGEPRFIPTDTGTASLESDPEDVYWDDQFNRPGADDGVGVCVADGAGNIYIGGSFLHVDNVPAHHVAKWDGSNWSPLGSGVNDLVRAIVISGSDVCVGGSFTTAGGVSANSIARWDGSSWHPLGSGIVGPVCALAVMGDNLYAGGYFMNAGGVSGTNNIARWDGLNWHPLGNGTDFRVDALMATGSDLYVGGAFTYVGDGGWGKSGELDHFEPSATPIPAVEGDKNVTGRWVGVLATPTPTPFGLEVNHIARWDGSTWSALGPGITGITVYCLVASATDVYVGGDFDHAGWGPAEHDNIARWDGANWHGLGSGMNYPVKALAVSDNQVYAGGSFTTAGGVSASHVARWDGSSWSAVGAGLPSSVSSLAESGEELYAAGGFADAHVARWDGSTWSSFGHGLGTTASVYTLLVSESGVYAGGNFTEAGGVSANRIVRWNGSAWDALGSGMDDHVHALAVGGGLVYAGGHFVTAGGVTANGIAAWNGSNWSSLGSGTDGTVYALALIGGDLYAGGVFTTAGGVSANNIAKWNGVNWSPLGSGVEGFVYDLVVSGTELYVAGWFSEAGGVSVSGVAGWNGLDWFPVGSGVSVGAYALAKNGSDLYVAASFIETGSPGAKGVARWDGSHWSLLGSGMNDTPSALQITESGLYVGGRFTTVSGVSANHIAKWDGSGWSAVGSGTNGNVLALASIGDALLVGGSFSTAGGKHSRGFAILQPRVNASTFALAAHPGDATLGYDTYGFHKPALVTTGGTTVEYAGGLPVDVTMEQAAEIHVGGVRVNGAFTLSPEAVIFGGTGATLRVEFSEDDAAAYGADPGIFRAFRLVYPPDYPANKEATIVPVPNSGAPLPVRIENGKHIYAIEVTISGISSMYGAIPKSLAAETGVEAWERYE